MTIFVLCGAFLPCAYILYYQLYMNFWCCYCTFVVQINGLFCCYSHEKGNSLSIHSECRQDAVPIITVLGCIQYRLVCYTFLCCFYFKKYLLLILMLSEWQMCSILASSFLTGQKDAIYYFYGSFYF